MALPSIATSSATPASSANGHARSSAESGKILIVDDLIRQRAVDQDQVPLMAFRNLREESPIMGNLLGSVWIDSLIKRLSTTSVAG